MFSFLKNHPFGVKAHFNTSLVLTFAVEKEKLVSLIPECLQLDSLKDKWGFVAVAIVDTAALRPSGFPKFLGDDFILIGYRVFVTYANRAGKRLRGLYILKSETNRKKMQYLGNIFTHYNYTTTDITQATQDGEIKIQSQLSGFLIKAANNSDEILLPPGSPFANWKEARRYAGPLPHTFTYDARSREVLIIEGVRTNWSPRPIKVLDYRLPFIDSLGIGEPVLANSFIIENIPYYWKKGKIEKWDR
jgi:hypothetical protein